MDPDARLTQLEQSMANVRATLADDLAAESIRFSEEEERLTIQLRSLRERHANIVSALQLNAAEQVRGLSEQVSHLKAERNLVAAINRLPPEVLSSKIFAILKALVAPNSRSWTNVTHVCRKWRHDALGDTSLWAEISGSRMPVDYLQTMLERSRPMPLLVNIEMIWKPEALSVVMGQAERFQKLRVHRKSEESMSKLLMSLSAVAPLLEELELSVGGRMCTLPPCLFATGAPLLRRLSLVGDWMVSPDTALLRHITRLSLRSTTSKLDFDSLSAVLSATKHLEHLSLVNIIPIQWRDAPRSTLGNLQSIRVVDVPLACDNFFSSFVLCPTCFVSVSTPATTTRGSNTCLLDTSDFPKLVAENHPLYTYASARVSDPCRDLVAERSMTVQAGLNTSVTDPALADDAQSLIRVDVANVDQLSHHRTDGCIRVLMAVLPKLNLQVLDTLRLYLDERGTTYTTVHQWHCIFAPLVCLRTLYMATPNLQVAIDALATRCACETELATIQLLPLPSLRHLHLNKLSEPDFGNQHEDLEPAQKRVIPSLLACMAARKQATPDVSELERLVLDGDLALRYQQIRTLEAYLPDIDLTCTIST